jgi:glycosyltransferase involved in cell wall biosynthesis
VKILLEMRPALDGHAGIPQETRLLFRGLSTLEGLQVEGLLQSSNRVIARGTPAPDTAAYRRMSIDQRIHKLSRVVVSLRASEGARVTERLSDALRMGVAPAGLLLRSLLGLKERLGHFDGEHFQDFVWRDLFARTLPVSDLPTVALAHMRVARTPWNLTHAAALATRRFGGPLYPRLDTRGFDVMLAETPYPGRVTAGTSMVVRYHDAIPILMPHTITDKSFHQASHYYALKRNVDDGAWFACVSDATRQDLLRIFPQAEPRAATVHNMVSHHYWPEQTSQGRLFEIVRTRSMRGGQATGRAAKQSALVRCAEPDPLRWMGPQHHYLLMVSTIEPRKNHLTLLAAWEQLRQERFPDLKLVIVGSLGWGHDAIVKRMRPWLDSGDVQMLEDVPAGELRLLYSHAAATVCPSLGEGFDFSGIEAMRCDTAVVASDIPVHRDIFQDAAEFFQTYSAPDLARAIGAVVDPDQPALREALVERGRPVSARYLPEVVLPQWRRFLDGVRAART